MKRIPDNVSMVIYIHILDEVRAMLATHEFNSHEWNAAHDRAITNIGKIKNVEEVCFDHQAWVKVGIIEAKTWEGAAAEVERARQKIFEILENLKK